ncbi:MAG: sulfonate transporter [Hyphomicrobiales bacterium]|nr:sulfonate transporter [Hyphomicrobiales bacterium]
MRALKSSAFILSALALLTGFTAARAAETIDTFKVAVGAPGNWDTCIPEVGKRAGIFRKHGIEIESLFTNGGGETMQAVISGSIDIGIAAGTAAAMGAFSKGAPVRILSAGTTGAGDLFWYVPAASPLKSFKDLAGKNIGYSTNGASTHTTLLALIDTFKVPAKPVATGAAAVTLTQAMSGQIDVGWASPPFGIEALQQGKIRLIARGSDAPSTAEQTVRVHIVNADVLEKRRAAVNRFMDAYRETLDFLYSDPKGIELYAEYAKIDVSLAARIRDDFMPKAAMNPDRVSGIDAITRDAMTYKVMQAPLTAAQLSELIQIPPRR